MDMSYGCVHFFLCYSCINAGEYISLFSMKPVLIDDLVKNADSQTEINLITSGGVRLRGWKIAKPLNHNLNFRERVSMAWQVFRGKAIAVRYFEDMTQDEVMEYALSNMKK